MLWIIFVFIAGKNCSKKLFCIDIDVYDKRYIDHIRNSIVNPVCDEVDGDARQIRFVLSVETMNNS